MRFLTLFLLAAPALADDCRWRGFEESLAEARRTRRSILVFIADFA